MQTTNQYVSNRVHPHFFEKIDGFRNNLALVNPEKTEILLKKAIIFIRSLQKQKKTLLFINNDPKLSFLVKSTSQKLKQYYSNENWVPGLLTNWDGFQPMLRSFSYCEKYFGNYLRTKQKLFPKYLKQKKKLEGLAGMRTKPSALILFQISGNESILKEAQLLNIPIVAFTDCTKSFLQVSYPIPFATNSIFFNYLFCSFLCK